MILAILAALTMTVGNLVALGQSNIKRMLAYSGIGQVGYLLMGVAALSSMASDGVILHLVGYGISTLTAFLCVIIYFNMTKKEEIADYAGLADRSPLLAMAMTVALFSLAGLPFFAGFTTKFYLFTAAASGGFLWLVGLAITNSLISLYYYLIVIKQMYMAPASDESALKPSLVGGGLLGVLVLAIFVLGVYPGPLVDAIQGATAAILP